MTSTITCDDILGKEAIDPDGSILGVITTLHIDKKSHRLTGITIDLGFMKPDLFVGIKYIRQFGVDAIFLKRVPIDTFKGLKVFTAKGELIGKVKSIVMDKKKKKIKEFIITKKGISRKKLVVKYSGIKDIGASVVLKRSCRFGELQ